VRIVITATAEVSTSEGDGGWLPSMGVDVKTHSTCPSDAMVLASGVRATARRRVSGGGTLRDVLVVHVADQHAITLGRWAVECARSGWPVGIGACVFFRKVREPSFYRGF
jgi:hypothetical protein